MPSIVATVRAFYDRNPFPAFDLGKYATTSDLRARASAYALLLDEQIPHAAYVADIGCGTGQLAALLALRPRRHVTGLDFSHSSLRYGKGLRDRFGLDNLELVEADALALPLADASHDVVLCNGVLHHTKAPRTGFAELARIVRPGGWIVVGVYGRYRRAIHGLVRGLTHIPLLERPIGDWGLKRMLGTQFEAADREKLRTWWEDQYRHPHESVHTAGEVLRWIAAEGLDYAAALPPIAVGEDASRPVLFPRRSRPRPTPALALLRQLGWIWQLRWTGGYFVIVARRRP